MKYPATRHFILLALFLCSSFAPIFVNASSLSNQQAIHAKLLEIVKLSRYQDAELIYNAENQLQGPNSPMVSS